MARKPGAGNAPPTWSSPEYLAECEARAKRVSIRYADYSLSGSAAWHEALLVHTWRRQDPEVQRGPIMSASSGPKDYLSNDIIGLFVDETIEAVSMFVLNGVPFLVKRRGPILHDVANGRPVQLRWEKRDAIPVSGG